MALTAYEEARHFAIVGLESSLKAHLSANWFAIEEGLEEYESLVALCDLRPNPLLLLSLEFWSDWSDTAVHDWHHYEPIKQDDWVSRAEIMLKNLRTNTEVTDEEILANFSLKSL